MTCSTITRTLEINRFCTLSTKLSSPPHGFFLGWWIFTPGTSWPWKPLSRYRSLPAGTVMPSSSQIFLSCFFPSWVLLKCLICLSSSPTTRLFFMVWAFFSHYNSVSDKWDLGAFLFFFQYRLCQSLDPLLQQVLLTSLPVFESVDDSFFSGFFAILCWVSS